MIPLGPFLLQNQIGKGGMGVVWRAIHKEQQEPVAIKILTRFNEQRHHSLSAFRDEVRAVAALHHPGIVQVLDHGEITEETAEASKGDLPKGSPYLIMELADGSLDQWRGRLSWKALRRVALSLLDALSHAHARGVIHRDLKPGNVLLSQRWRKIKLADFGIAYDMEGHTPTEHADKITGTLAYMSPEQFEREFHHYGPWTDLYAFGCLMYSLATGNPPFGSKGTLMELMFRHLCNPVPPLKTDMEYPDGFEDWLRCLLEKAPGKRFQRAADAAWGLLSLEDADSEDDLTQEIDQELFMHLDQHGPDSSSQRLPSPKTRQASVETAQATAFPLATLQTLIDEYQHTAIVEARKGTPPPSIFESNDSLDEVASSNEYLAFLSSMNKEQINLEIPPFPDSWRRQETMLAPLRLDGVGLGLYGVRNIPLVGREEERDALWESMHRVRSRHRLYTICLRGPAGYGKSRLAEWFCERTHEVGTAHVLKAVHSPIQGASDGITPMLIRFLQCAGSTFRQAEEKVPDILERLGMTDAEDIQTILDLMAPYFAGGSEHKTRVRLENETERYVVIRRFLQHLSKSRPVLVWLDDIHWGLDTLGFVLHLQETLRKLEVPILLLLTVREEALVEQPQETEMLDEILAAKRTHSVHIGPLHQEDRPVLIRELLGLEGDVAAQVEERTAGNPLFAVQLVGDWVQRGLLEYGTHGFRLKEGTEVTLPDDMHAVWAARLEQLFTERSENDRIALELAAILGQEIDGEEWRDVCQQINIYPPYDLVEQLIGQRLARTEHNPFLQWSFVHGMLRESLQRQAQEAERWTAHHLACAQTLKRRKSRNVTERMAQHLLAAGEFEQALIPLHAAIKERLRLWQHRIAMSLLLEWEPLLDRCALPEDHLFRGESMLVRSTIAYQASRYEEAKEWSKKTEAAARKYGWDEVLLQVSFTLSKLAWNDGMSEESMRPLEEAELLANKLGDESFIARAHAAMGDLLCRRGQLEEARPWLQQAKEDFEKIGDVLGIADNHRSLCHIARQTGAYDQANDHIEEAQRFFEECGSREGIADCYNLRGEIARLQGDFERAEELYRVSIKRHRALESIAAGVAELNLGLTLIRLKRYKDARVILEDCVRTFLLRGRPLLRSIAQITLLPCLIADDAWIEAEQNMLSSTIALSNANYVDIDVAASAQLAGEIALEKGKPMHAKPAYRFALSQWKALDRQEEVEQIEQALRVLV